MGVMLRNVAASILVCVMNGGVAAAQTAGTPPPSLPPTPSPGASVQGSAGWLDLSAKTGERRSPLVSVPWATDLRLPKGWTFRFESPATCTGCPDRTGALVSNPNALWQTSGAVAWQVGGATLGVRLTGQRGARLPLFMNPAGSATALPMASDVIMSDPRTQWVLTLSAEYIVLASSARTTSLFGDLYLPLGSIGRAPKTADVRTPPQSALIGGVRIRSKAPLP